MGRASTLAMALVAALAVGACADGAGDLSTAPNTPALQTADHAGILLTCTPPDLQKYARNLLGSRDPGVTQAKLITTRNANSTAALNAGYAVMSAVAGLRAATASGAWTVEQQTNATELTIQLIACMDVQFSDPTLTVDQLRTALQGALDPDDSGAYAVPGTAAVVVAHNLGANLSTAGSPAGPGTFAAWLPGGSSLVLGHSIATFAMEISGGAAYNWMTVRPYGASTYVGEAVIGLCPTAPVPPNQLRIEHAHGTNTILPFYTATGLDCPETGAALEFPAARTFAGRMVQGLFNLVRPAPLFASAVLLTGPGGGVRLLSPFEVIEPIAVKVSFVQPPVSLAVNEVVVDADGNPMKVLVTGNNGTPWQGVDVTVTGEENNGATLALTCGVQTTDANGEVTFPGLSINKPGGIKLVATVDPAQDLDGTAFSGTATTDRFNVGPGTATPPVCQ